MLRRANRNKRGALPVYEAVMWIARGLIMVYLLLSVKFVTGAFIVKTIDTRMVDSYVLMNVMYYSDGATALKDAQTKRIYHGIVDFARPSDIAAFGLGEGKGAFMASSATLTVPGFTKEFFYDQATFKDWNTLYIAGLTEGAGGVRKYSVAKKLIAYDNGKMQNADATMAAVSKNA